MQSILSVDVEDWFHILEVNSSPRFELWARLESRVERNVMRLLDEFDINGIKVTCFFLGWVAERFPHLVLEVARRGHEIASHGYSHRLIYTQSRQEFREDIRKAKDILENTTGTPVLGYRAPGFSIVKSTIWALEELVTAGHQYDSSIFPTGRGHGGLVGAETSPHSIATPSGAIFEFPISVANFLGRKICFFGGGYLRLFPYSLIRRMSHTVHADGRPVVYYVHPREIDPSHPRLPMGPFRKFKSYLNLNSTMPKLSALLRDQELTTFQNWLATHAQEFLLSQNSQWPQELQSSREHGLAA